MGLMFIGECSVCRQGRLVAVKDIDTNSLLVMCDDCESQWRSPTDARSSANVLIPDARRVVDARLEETRHAGWLPQP